MILIYGKKIHFRENWLIFLGIWGEAELSLGFWGAKANNFREKKKLFSGSWGDQCIISRDLGSTYPPGASLMLCYKHFAMNCIVQQTEMLYNLKGLS